MFQISVMINVKPNLKGLRIVHALNITRTSENHEEFERAVDIEIPTETCTHDIKKC